MKFTLADCVERLNQILNYPSLEYINVEHFFDQAISEINSELHLGLRPISEIYQKSKLDLKDLKDVVMLSAEPVLNIPVYESIPENPADIYLYNGLIHYNGDKTTNKLYAVARDSGKMYQTVILGGGAYWYTFETSPELRIDLTEYMPYDWIVLFLIPYICFRYAVRDGDSGAMYAEDFGNGFQQLRNSYDIPTTVLLSQQAGKLAYYQDTLDSLPNLNIQVPTRAIYENMKVSRAIAAQHGSVYDRGGWGF